MGEVQVRRIYDPPRDDDGRRVLVDRFWPSGVSRERADLDDWFKEVAPSSDLSDWYEHEPDRFDEFARRYRHELEHPGRAQAYARLDEMTQDGTVTLLTATEDTDVSEAAILADLLNHHATP